MLLTEVGRNWRPTTCGIMHWNYGQEQDNRQSTYDKQAEPLCFHVKRHSSHIESPRRILLQLLLLGWAAVRQRLGDPRLESGILWFQQIDLSVEYHEFA